MIQRTATVLFGFFAMLPGAIAVADSGYYLRLDWASLNRSFALWEHLVREGGGPRAFNVADTYQAAFRMNCFADGVGVLLGLILFTIGLHGIVSVNSQ